jgi:uncharacterized protein
MARKSNLLISLFLGIILLAPGARLMGQGADSSIDNSEEKRVLEWRKERDIFFKTHERSPLTPQAKKNFKSLKYYPFHPKYVFSGQIERFIFQIDNPKYYATFLTNKGTNKRYLRYGKFRLKMDGQEHAIEIYKSILSDNLFIPFKDKTNGKETYEGGRYIDAEILVGYKMVLDFNMAYSPACVYNDRFICVLPPKENTLEIMVEAGEKNSIFPK